jgi:hypothetical protein
MLELSFVLVCAGFELSPDGAHFAGGFATSSAYGLLQTQNGLALYFFNGRPRVLTRA